MNLPPLNLPEATFAIGRPSQLSRQSRQVRHARSRQQVSSPPPNPALKGFTGAIKPFHEMFPSLLSILSDIPLDVQIAMSVCNSTLLGRQKYMLNLWKNVYTLKASIQQYDKHGVLTDKTLATEEQAKRLQHWFAKEQKVRTALRYLLAKWLYAKYKTRMLNTEDPCTLEPCKNPVYIFDAARRGMYQLEASSLKRQVEFNLGFSDWLYPEPSIPKNPLTNLEFHPGQLLRVLQGIRRAGFGSWMLEGFTAKAFHLKRFTLDYGQPLRIHAVRELVKQPKSEQLVEFLQEFIVDMYDENEIVKPSIKVILQWAVEHEMDDPYMQEWLTLWKDFSITKIQYNLRDNSNDVLNKFFVKSMLLFDNTLKLAEFGERRLASLVPRTSRRTRARLAPPFNMETILIEMPPPALVPTVLGGGLVLPSQLQNVSEFIELTNLINNLVVHDTDEET